MITQIQKCLIIALCFTSTRALAAEKLGVSELLDRYAANQDKLVSFIVKTEDEHSVHWHHKERPDFHRWVTEFRFDIDKACLDLHMWNDLAQKEAATSSREADYCFQLWNGDLFVEYCKFPARDAGNVAISTDQKHRESMFFVCAGVPFLGVRYSDSERIDQVLRKADVASVRDRVEQIGSSSCYVIDAKTKSGTYTVWLDPEHSFQIARADIQVESNNLYRGKMLDKDESGSLSVRNIRFEKINDMWIPMEADIYRTSIRQRIDSSCTSTTHHKITRVTFNPDHEDLGSFIPEIENGTAVGVFDTDKRYIWDNDKKFVVDKVDGSIKYVPKNWSVQVEVGKPLPEFDGIKLALSTEQIEAKAILVCFFDMNQRPSRNCLQQLAERAEELKGQDIIVLAVQTSDIEKQKLEEWFKQNNIPFPVGIIAAEIEKTKFTWGVKSLPWLILTDEQHIVTAEGITIAEIESKKLSVSELLDRYAANQDKLTSLVVKTEEKFVSKWSHEPNKNFVRWITECRTDGKRISLKICYWDDLKSVDDTVLIAEAQHRTEIWNGELYFEIYDVPTKIPKSYLTRVGVSSKERHIKSAYLMYQGAPFFGVRFSDYERIDLVLRQADVVSVRDKLEQVGSVACYVIDAKTKSGDYIVWIDPEHGYQIAKADIHVGPNDYLSRRKFKDGESESLSVTNVRFEKIDDVYIPIEADIYNASHRLDRPDVQNTIHHKVTQIILNPDHDALKSFCPEIDEGTEVRDMDSRARYRWDNEKKLVVDKWDDSIKYVPKDWSIQVETGKSLPAFEDLKLNLSSEQCSGKAVLICFFDMNQRPSRNCLKELAERAGELRGKDIVVAAVQASDIEKQKLDEWIKENNIPFPVGIITADVEKTLFTWGIRSLPWLILADRNHIITTEGITVTELNEKLGNNTEN